MTIPQKEAWQAALKELVRGAGYRLEVGRDALEPRLKDVLDTEERRALRRWTGGYRGREGKQVRGAFPRESRRVEQIIKRLLASPHARRCPDQDERAARLIEALTPQPARRAGFNFISQTNHQQISACLASFVHASARQVFVDVVTGRSSGHAITAACVTPVIGRCRHLMNGRPLQIRIRLIERGEAIPIQPDFRLSSREEQDLRVLRATMPDSAAPIWHGTIVSTPDNGCPRPIGAIFGFEGEYHVRESGDGPNARRELIERLTEFDRAWRALESRSWALRRSSARPARKTRSLPSRFRGGRTQMADVTSMSAAHGEHID